MKKGQVTRIVVVPAFMEAAGLLAGAAELWTGRYGAGRLAANELRSAAYRLLHAGHEWLHCGLGWSGAGTEYDDAGFRLAQHRDHRSFLITTLADQDRKNPRMATRLIETALRLIDKSIPMVRLTGREEVSNGQAEEFEDLMEGLLNLQCSKMPDPPVSADALAIIERRAAFRVAEGLAASALSVHHYAATRHQDELRETREMWQMACVFFRQKAAELFRRFASCDGLPPEDTESILMVENDATAYCFGDWHYDGPDTVRRSGEIAAALISILLLSVGIEPASWDNEDVGSLLSSGARLLEASANQ